MRVEGVQQALDLVVGDESDRLATAADRGLVCSNITAENMEVISRAANRRFGPVRSHHVLGLLGT